MQPAAIMKARLKASQDSVPPVLNRFFEFSLLGMLAAGYLAVLSTGFLDWPTTMVMGLALVMRVLLLTGVLDIEICQRLLSPRLINILLTAYLIFFFADLRYVSGNFLAAVVHMVFFLAVIKLLTAQTSRDYGALKIIASLELIAAAVLSTGLGFLVFLTIFLLFGIATLASSEIRRAASSSVTSPLAMVSRAGLQTFPRRLGTVIVSLFAGILFLATGLFIVLPRTARAAFERVMPQRFHFTGFSNSVTLGEIGRLEQNNTAVMHVRSYQETPLPSVKWRGSALSQFDGTRWYNPPFEERAVEVRRGAVTVRSAVLGTRQGRNLIYRARLEPLIADTLFFAGLPETINVDLPLLRYGPAGTFHVPARSDAYRAALNYSVYAFLPNEWAEVRFTSSPLPTRAREEMLNLPPTLDPRIRDLARQMTSGTHNDIEQARALESHLQKDYGYTLELLSKPVPDPLAYFLFERKKGHCEYFASAMAVMLRTLGIPSRVVTGFQSGVYNPMTGWQVIRASDAHSWVEAWLDGRGWTTFDPTPFATASAPGFFAKFAMLEDTAGQYWQDWVLTYDLGHQVAIASRMQTASRRFRLPDFESWSVLKNQASDLAANVLSFIALFALAVAAYLYGPALLRRWRQRARTRRLVQGHGDKTDATILYEEMLDDLKKRGLQKPGWLTPVEFVRVLPPSDLAPLIDDATRAYNEFRFGGRSDAAPRFVHILQQIRQL